MSDGSNFEIDPLPDWKPVELNKGRRDVVTTSNRRCDETGYGILNKLETVD